MYNGTPQWWDPLRLETPTRQALRRFGKMLLYSGIQAAILTLVTVSAMPQLGWKAIGAAALTTFLVSFGAALEKYRKADRRQNGGP